MGTPSRLGGIRTGTTADQQPRLLLGGIDHHYSEAELVDEIDRFGTPGQEGLGARVESYAPSSTSGASLPPNRGEASTSVTRTDRTESPRGDQAGDATTDHDHVVRITTQGPRPTDRPRSPEPSGGSHLSGLALCGSALRVGPLRVGIPAMNEGTLAPN